MLTQARVSILSGSFVLGLLALDALTACYSVEFDEQESDAYYCQSADDCLETQACTQFRCVDDRGPHVSISGPEPLTDFPAAASTLEVTFNAENLALDESNAVQEGFGKVLLTIDPHAITPITALVDTETALLPLGAGLAPGPHRLIAQAVYGDGTPYVNPSSSAHTVFLSVDDSPRPYVALMDPAPGHIHVAGEPLQVNVRAFGFTFVNLGEDCPVPQGCDPFTDDTCVPSEEGCTGINTVGHTHIYLLENYPDCLETTPEQPVSCNLNYIESIRPEGDGSMEVSKLIDGEKFPEAGNFMLTAALQYSNHAPYPNVDFVIYDQIPITIIER